MEYPHQPERVRLLLDIALTDVRGKRAQIIATRRHHLTAHEQARPTDRPLPRHPPVPAISVAT